MKMKLLILSSALLSSALALGQANAAGSPEAGSPQTGLSPAGPTRNAARPSVASPVIQPDGKVTFNLYAPNAASVSVNGQLYPALKKGDPAGAPMTKDDKGVWSVTLGPLLPYFYQYYFIVDGVQALDPQNQHVAYGMNWLIVPGDKATNYLYNNVPHGTMSLVWYPSPALGAASRRMTVYTPPGYEDSTARYPVLYLLHGGNASEHTWWESGRLPEVLDNLIAQGKAVPMIVVLPNGNETQTMTNAEADVPAGRPGQGGGAGGPGRPGQQGGAGGPGRQPGAGGQTVSARFPESLVSDIIPYVDRHYRTKADREDRAIIGLSLGSQQAAYTVFHYVDKFAWYGNFGMEFLQIPNLGSEWGLKTYPLFAAGGAPRAAGEESPAKGLDKDGVRIFKDVLPDYGSEAWRGGIGDFASWIFKSDR